MSLDPARVSALLAEVCAAEILPRWRRLAPHEIEAKPSENDPGDLVTVADRAAEDAITRGLAALAPGVPVLGEEAAHANPALRRLVSAAGPLFLLDPIDGTRDFAAGHDSFGTMLAYAEDGLVRAAWILQPARGRSYVAEAGAGAYRDGVRLVTRPRDGLPRGSVVSRFLSPPAAAAVSRAADGHYAPVLAGPAAIAYPAIAEGALELVVYHRLLPWDHAPGALLVREAGGVVVHSDGAPYTLASPDQLTIVAATPAVAAIARGFTALPPELR